MTFDYIPREIVPRLAGALKHLPAVVLSGLRQTGKSTMLRNETELVKNREYRTLDDFATLKAAQTNPEGLLSERVALDEVQRCPEMLVAVKKSIDDDRRPGRFILSGSANLALLGRVSETLAGRAGYFTLHPMTRRELLRRIGGPPYLIDFMTAASQGHGRAVPVSEKEVLAGGLPPACLGPAEGLEEWFRAYEQTYVERDVRQLSQITDLVAFRTLAQLAALRTGQVLVISALARDAKLSAATAGRYLGLLEASFLVHRLPPFTKNRSVRLVKSPKLYYTDSGLAAHMAGVTVLGPREDERLRGALFETYFVQNALSILESHKPKARVSYWHEQGRHEVDLVIEAGKQVTAIELKAASRWQDRDLSGLRAFLDRTPACRSAVLAYNGTETVKLADRLWAIPMGLLLS